MPGGLIRFEGVWKKFRRGERHDSLRDLIPALGRALLRRNGLEELRRQEFWALQDVTFDVKPGDALGIIGPNGAGKSTVLKILINLLRPTHGRSRVDGRIGSLIELGGALHPDLTGRENIFLQGSVMGMRRTEIASKFDEIVEFSELADFIDTPVKRYSSGMNARLGFSVAAHLESDVLIIDEVLAVGDAAFQRRAFDRMKAMVARGVPTIIVSHQLERVASMCTKAILLTRGRIVCEGPPGVCIAAYARESAAPPPPGPGDGVGLDSIRISGTQPVPSGDRIQVLIAGRAPMRANATRPIVALRVRSIQTGEVVFATGTLSHSLELPPGPFELGVELQMNVPPGIYAIESSIGRWQRERDAPQGAAELVHVSGGQGFWGPVQMNCEMRLARLAESGGSGRG